MGNAPSTSQGQQLQAASFDESRFTQISPSSTLSNPSNFGRHRQPPPPQQLQRSLSRVAVRNQPTSNGHQHNQDTIGEQSLQLLRKKKKKKKRSHKKVTQCFAGCFQESAHVVDKVKIMTQNCTTATTTKMKAFKASLKTSAMPSAQEHVATAVVDPNVIIHPPPLPTEVSFFFQRSEETTPKCRLLDHEAFDETMTGAVHQEEDYFDRLATSAEPSPYMNHHHSRSMSYEQRVSRHISEYDVGCLFGDGAMENSMTSPSPTVNLRYLNPDESALMSLYLDEEAKNRTMEMSFMTSPVSAMLRRSMQEPPTPVLQDSTFMSLYVHENDNAVNISCMESPIVADKTPSKFVLLETVLSPTPTTEFVMSPMEQPTPQPSIFRERSDTKKHPVVNETKLPTMNGIMANQPKLAPAVLSDKKQKLPPLVVVSDKKQKQPLPVVVSDKKQKQPPPVVVSDKKQKQPPPVVVSDKKQTQPPYMLRVADVPALVDDDSLFLESDDASVDSDAPLRLRTDEELLKTDTIPKVNTLASYMLSSRSFEKRKHFDPKRSMDALNKGNAVCHNETQDYRNIALSTSETSDIPDIMPVQSREMTFSSPAPNHRMPLLSPSMDSIMSTPGKSPVPLLSNQCLSNAAFLFSPSYAGGNAAPLPAQNHCMPLMSPCMDSIMSTPGKSPVPLLSNQCLSNAAFLFSPSYAGGQAALLPKPGALAVTAFSISTFPSRSRLGSASSRSQQSVTIPVAGTSTLSRSSWSQSVQESSQGRSQQQNLKQVRFSDTDNFCDIETLERSSVTHMAGKFVNADIQTKISDLSETSSMFGAANFKGLPFSNAGDRTPEKASETAKTHWSYRQGDTNKMTTPVSYKSNPGVPSKSPMLRFRFAKEKFANPEAKKVPAKKTPPKKFWNRTPKKSLVSTRIADLHYQLTKNARTGSMRRTETAASIQLTRSNDEFESAQRVVKRSKERMSMQTAPPPIINEFPYDETFAKENERSSIPSRSSASVSRSASDSTVVSSSVASESIDVFAMLRTKSLHHNDKIIGNDDDSVSDDDAFATLLAQPTEEDDDDDDETAPTVIRPKGSSQVEYTSRFTINAYTSSNTDDKENTSLHKSALTTSKVNPELVRHPQNLHLSPLQRTPLQTRRWRSLAAAVQEKEKIRTKLLTERSVNGPRR